MALKKITVNPALLDLHGIPVKELKFRLNLSIDELDDVSIDKSLMGDGDMLVWDPSTEKFIQGSYGTGTPLNDIWKPTVSNIGIITWDLSNSAATPSPQDIRGLQGFQGPTGATGDTGVQGPQGNTGTQGPTGPTGSKGDQGPTGNDGSIGPQGTQGDIGPQGEDGLQGPRGDQGLPGSTGPKGDQGDIGLQGDIGPQGTQGDIGPQGTQGDIGPQGIQGEQGPIGATGPQGEKGDTGEDGADGVNGAVAMTLSAARNNMVSDSFLFGTADTPTNVTPFILPFDAKLQYISSSCEYASTYSIKIYESGSYVIGANLDIINNDFGYKEFLTTMTFAAGSKVSIYCEGSAVPNPRIDLIFIKS